MGDPRRFHLFAALIAECYPAAIFPKVADVAGGKGYLQIALKERHYKVTTFDRRRNTGRLNYQHRMFTPTVRDQFDLLVGMHPDKATDVIIVEAARRNIPFAVCPCCVKPWAVDFKGPYKSGPWMDHLEALARSLGFATRRELLRMNGRRECLLGTRIA